MLFRSGTSWGMWVRVCVCVRLVAEVTCVFMLKSLILYLQEPRGFSIYDGLFFGSCVERIQISASFELPRKLEFLISTRGHVVISWALFFHAWLNFVEILWKMQINFQFVPHLCL